MKSSLERVIAIVLALVVAWVAFQVGQSSGRADSVDREAAKLAAESKKHLDSEFQATQGELEANKAKLKTLEDFEGKVGSLRADNSRFSSELKALKGQVEEKQAELERLTARVNRERTKPVRLPAGQFIVGRDIRPGRYQVYGDSNFVVRGPDGELKVNTILGSNGNESYVCDLQEGDSIQAESSVTFQPL